LVDLVFLILKPRKTLLYNFLNDREFSKFLKEGKAIVFPVNSQWELSIVFCDGNLILSFAKT